MATNPERKRCAAIATTKGTRCMRTTLAGSDFCSVHSPANKSFQLIRDVNSNDPAFRELAPAVDAIRTLLTEHLTQLESARVTPGCSNEEYLPALEAHGKRIQSLASELVSALDRLSRIQERRRSVLTMDEASRLLSEIKERVIAAAQSAEPGEPPAALAQRLANAFESIRVARPTE